MYSLDRTLPVHNGNSVSRMAAFSSKTNATLFPQRGVIISQLASVIIPCVIVQQGLCVWFAGQFVDYALFGPFAIKALSRLV